MPNTNSLSFFLIGGVIPTRNLSSNQPTKDTKMAINIGDMRNPYRDKSDIFDLGDLTSKDPFDQFESWFQDAKNDGELDILI